MNKYEAMFIIKPDLSEADRKNLLNQISDSVVKNNGGVVQESIWSEKRKLCFPIKKCREGVYYLMNFNITGEMIAKIKNIYKLNENILRVLITRLEG